MTRKRTLLITLLAAALALVPVATALAGQPGELPELRAATAAYFHLANAEAAGYGLVPGLDHCFNNPGVGAMGFHYIDTAALDLALDPLHPEALVYAPLKSGKLLLAAVEYIVPAAAWDAAGNTEPPMLYDRMFHLNAALGVYVLHAWIWYQNPAGLFEDWNPRVSCPA
jgi:hypothetical protein